MIPTDKLQTLTAGFKAVSDFLSSMNIDDSEMFAALKAAALLTNEDLEKKLAILEVAVKNRWSAEKDAARRDQLLAQGRADDAAKFERRIKGATNALSVVRKAIAKALKSELANRKKPVPHLPVKRNQTTDLTQVSLDQLEQLYWKIPADLADANPNKEPYDILRLAGIWIAQFIAHSSTSREVSYRLLQRLIFLLESESGFAEEFGSQTQANMHAVEIVCSAFENIRSPYVPEARRIAHVQKPSLIEHVSRSIAMPERKTLQVQSLQEKLLLWQEANPGPLPVYKPEVGQA